MNKEKKKLTKREKGLLIAFIISLIIMIFQTFALGLKTNNTALKTTNEPKRAYFVNDTQTNELPDLMMIETELKVGNSTFTDGDYLPDMMEGNFIDYDKNNFLYKVNMSNLIGYFILGTEYQNTFLDNFVYMKFNLIVPQEYFTFATDTLKFIIIDGQITIRIYYEDREDDPIEYRLNQQNSEIELSPFNHIVRIQIEINDKNTILYPIQWTTFKALTTEVYANYYSQGFNLAKEIYTEKIDNLNREIFEMQGQQAVLQMQVERLTYQLEQANGGYSIADDIFTIADAPITMIQQILNFNILGINLWAFFSAIITILLGVWLIKLLI